MYRLFFHGKAPVVILAVLMGGCGGAAQNAAVPKSKTQTKVEPEQEARIEAAPERKAFSAVTEDGRFNLRAVDSAVTAQNALYRKQLAFTSDTVWIRDRLRHYPFTRKSFEDDAPETYPVILTEQSYRGRDTTYRAPLKGDGCLYISYYDTLTRIETRAAHATGDKNAADKELPPTHRFEEKILGLWTAPEKPVVAVTASYFLRTGVLYGLWSHNLSTLWRIDNVIADTPVEYEGFIFAVQEIKDNAYVLLKISPQDGAVTARLPLVGRLNGPMRLAGNELHMLLEAKKAPRGVSSLFYATVDLSTLSSVTYLDLKERKNGFGDIPSSFITLSKGNGKYRAAALLYGTRKIILLGPNQKREITLPGNRSTEYSGLERLAQVEDTLFAAGRDILYLADLNKEEVTGSLVFKSASYNRQGDPKKSKIKKIGALGSHVFVQGDRRLFHLKVATNPKPEALTRLHHISSPNWPISDAEALTDGNPDTRFTISRKTDVFMHFSRPVLISGVDLLPAAKSTAKQKDESAALTLEWNTDKQHKNAPEQKPVPYAEVSDIHTFTARCGGKAPCSTSGAVQLLE